MLSGVESSGKIQIIRLVVGVKRKLTACWNGSNRTVQSRRRYAASITRRNELYRNVGSRKGRVEHKRFDIAVEERAVVTQLNGPFAPVVFSSCPDRLEYVINWFRQFLPHSGTLQIRHSRRQ